MKERIGARRCGYSGASWTTSEGRCTALVRILGRFGARVDETEGVAQHIFLKSVAPCGAAFGHHDKASPGGGTKWDRFRAAHRDGAHLGALWGAEAIEGEKQSIRLSGMPTNIPDYADP